MESSGAKTQQLDLTNLVFLIFSFFLIFSNKMEENDPVKNMFTELNKFKGNYISKAEVERDYMHNELVSEHYVQKELVLDELISKEEELRDEFKKTVTKANSFQIPFDQRNHVKPVKNGSFNYNNLDGKLEANMFQAYVLPVIAFMYAGLCWPRKLAGHLPEYLDWREKTYVSPKVDQYQMKHTGAREKVAVNGVLESLTKAGYGDKTKAFNVLDYADLKTSQALMNGGVKKEQINVHNFDKDFCEKVTVPVNDRPNIYNADILDYIKTQEGGVPQHWCFDFCGKIDNFLWFILVVCFRRLVLLSNGLIWFTISTRNYKKDVFFIILREFAKQLYAVFGIYFNVAFEKQYGTVYTVIFITGKEFVDTDFSFTEDVYNTLMTEGADDDVLIPILLDEVDDEVDDVNDNESCLADTESLADIESLADTESLADIESLADTADTESEEEEELDLPAFTEENGKIRFVFSAVSKESVPLYINRDDFDLRACSSKGKGQLTVDAYHAFSNKRKWDYLNQNLKWMLEEEDTNNSTRRKRVKRDH